MYSKYNNDDYDENKPNTYNVYINGEKNKNAKKKYTRTEKKSDLERFIDSKNDQKKDFVLESDFIYDGNETLDDLPYLEFDEKHILKILDVSILTIISILLFVLFIYNIVCISVTTKEVEANIREIASDEILLESKQHKLKQTTQENLISVFDESGYFYIEDYFKTFLPETKNVVNDYTPTTNWFDIICNFIFEILTD